MSRLTGKVALVTGGSRGIGAAVARRLAEDGAHVAITYREAEHSAKSVVADIESYGRTGLAVQADSADATAVVEAVDRTVAELGRLDILVNNAGVFSAGPIETVSLDDLDRAIAVHVRGVFLATQAAVRHMRDGGRIVNIGSSFASRVPDPGVSVYAMTKIAVNGLTRALARELGPRGITVNVVLPGSTDTDMNPADGAYADAQRAHIALGRYGTPDDVAATISHLVGEGGRHISGASFAVDGGSTA
ncbi:SDR family NAD(P)-dependent oxidoreductase [Micromonospora olivasterospora]|uniref:NAD(P)-dependent dehydrogenase (Short-subunit alcohol dehydrogenase family) n=1 Tax=Micromonospora olivasterospora TaxID=1880 RepID=A0A562I9X6_MICOL|nr:3-oxoacyl-ACP reductase family protein [Micromonospora olivasterospora]TWH67656.1 NAD(P)-dependent dehydrogenase (short-subunit alcohol dehydrogenase family) [Micromonospora olivasterospora]